MARAEVSTHFEARLENENQILVLLASKVNVNAANEAGSVYPADANREQFDSILSAFKDFYKFQTGIEYEEEEAKKRGYSFDQFTDAQGNQYLVITCPDLQARDALLQGLLKREAINLALSAESAHQFSAGPSISSPRVGSFYQAADISYRREFAPSPQASNLQAQGNLYSMPHMPLYIPASAQSPFASPAPVVDNPLGENQVRLDRINYSEDIPDEFMDSIKMQIMNDPVRLQGNDSQICDYSVIERMRREGNERNPFTNLPLASGEIEHLSDLRQRINDFVDRVEAQALQSEVGSQAGLGAERDPGHDENRPMADAWEQLPGDYYRNINDDLRQAPPINMPVSNNQQRLDAVGWPGDLLPEEFEDPIRNIIMDDPAELEGSKKILDNATIENIMNHGDGCDPYTRQKIRIDNDACDVTLLTELKQNINNYVDHVVNSVNELRSSKPENFSREDAYARINEEARSRAGLQPQAQPQPDRQQEIQAASPRGGIITAESHGVPSLLSAAQSGSEQEKIEQPSLAENKSNAGSEAVPSSEPQVEQPKSEEVPNSSSSFHP